ncbi:MAG TPA: nucleotidyltransferase family protein [Candidatus Binataceae bacterium]
MQSTTDPASDLTAIVLCGGKGERLKPFTDAIPKPLVLLNNRPLLEHLLHYLSASGVHRFILCVGYKAELIEQFVREKRDPRWDIRCVNSGDAGMIDRILDASEGLAGPALICYGDTLANVDIDDLRATHRNNNALATVTVYRLHSPFGIVEIDDAARVSAFAEKPVLPHWINIGFLLCEPGAFAHMRRGSDLPEYLSMLAREKLLFAYRHQGRHLTVNTEKDRQAAEAAMVEFVTLMDDVKL